MAARFSKTPEIFTTIPPQPKEKKPGQLSHEQIQHYFEKGYVVVPEFFSKQELQPVMDAIEDRVEVIAERLYKAGKITNKHKDASFYERLTLLEKQFPGAAILTHKNGILPKGFQDLWSNDRLLNVVEQMIGPEIAGQPVWNLRTKVPKNDQVTVPWHQDNAYLSDDGNEILIPTAWIPLIDACRDNGCMEVVQAGHRKCYLAKHYCCAGPTIYVEMKEEDMVRDLDVDMDKDIVLCEVPMGGILFINNLIPHRSLPNNSNQIRWSIDLRWCLPGKDNAFFGLKDSVLMRTAKDPNFKLNWEEFANISRAALESGNMEKANEEDEDLDPIIIGPWMGRWEIIHHNRNTERYLASEADNKNSTEN